MKATISSLEGQPARYSRITHPSGKVEIFNDIFKAFLRLKHLNTEVYRDYL